MNFRCATVRKLCVPVRKWQYGQLIGQSAGAPLDRQYPRHLGHSCPNIPSLSDASMTWNPGGAWAGSSGGSASPPIGTVAIGSPKGVGQSMNHAAAVGDECLTPNDARRWPRSSVFVSIVI